jgi:hypothetical protein
MFTTRRMLRKALMPRRRERIAAGDDACLTIPPCRAPLSRRLGDGRPGEIGGAARTWLLT